MGELHLEVLVDRLIREFNIGVNVGNPQVSYKETVTSRVSEEFELSQVIGGKSQYARLEISVEPVEASKNIEFLSEIDKDSIPQSFVAAIRQGIEEASGGGMFSGFPQAGIRVRLKSAVFNEEDSTEMSFKIAGTMAFKQACAKANPAILEPVMKIEVVVPSEFMGSVINDFNGRRKDFESRIVKMFRWLMLRPLSEMLGYATALRSLTQGRAVYTMQFDRYEAAGRAVRKRS